MAKKTYDIIKRLLPQTMFQQTLAKNTAVYQSEPLPTSIIGAVVADPLVGLTGTRFIFRVNNSDDLTTVFSSDDITTSIAEIEATAAASGYPGLLTITYGPTLRVTIQVASGNTIEVMEGNQLLGFYERHDFKALLKVLAPAMDEFRNAIKSINSIIDVDNAPQDFLRQLGILLNYKWRDDLDIDEQRKLIKQLPYVYRFKGTIPSIKRIVRLRGGIAEVFEPWKYISRYDEDAWDGEKLFSPTGTYSFTNGETLKGPLGFQRLKDTTNAPFTSEDEHRYVYIPDLPGPIDGHKISRVISSSEIEIPSAGLPDTTGLVYTVLDPPRIYSRLESREFWHEGVYEILADIPAELYRQEVLDLVHPAGRIVYFVYSPDIPVIEDDTQDPSPLEITTTYDLRIGYGEDCGTSWDEFGGWDLDTSDGCQDIWGFDVKIDFVLNVTFRVPLAWSQVLHWDDVSGYPLYFLPEYVDSSTQINVPEILPLGHQFLHEYTDIQAPPHVINYGYTGIIDAGGISPNDLTGIIPTGAKILLVNEGGTPDKTTDSFTGGTDYTEGVDWSQSGNVLTWIMPIGPSGPLYTVFYKYDSYNLVT